MIPLSLGRRLTAAASALAVAVAVGVSVRAAGRSRSDLGASARSRLSRIEGTIEVPGLGAPVEVIRDRWGIPHIYARTEDDLFFAQGFVQAQDRLFQMELWRRQTQGRLAEFLGPEWVERDRMTRLVTRYRGDLDVEWASYGGSVRRAAERFVAGSTRRSKAPAPGRPWSSLSPASPPSPGGRRTSWPEPRPSA